MYAHAETEAVEQRHCREHLVADAEHRVCGDYLLAEGVEVQVREQNTLGRAGGAAGIEYGGGVVSAALYAVVPEAGLAEMHELIPEYHRRICGYLLDFPALGEHIACLHRTGERVLYAGDNDIDGAGVLAYRLYLVIELVERHDRHALGLIYVKLKLLFAGERVDHVRNGADEVHRVKHIYCLRAVRHRDGDLVVFTHTDGAQTAGAFFDVCDHLAVGGGSAHEIKGNVIGICVGYSFDSLEHGALEVF